MKKIPTLFLRDPLARHNVIAALNPDCTWLPDAVAQGDAVATRKYDGTCVELRDGGTWRARREVRPGKAAPSGFVPISTDAVTGKTVGWEPIGNSAFAKFHTEAVTALRAARPGTYELCGPRINRNPENFPAHILLRHADAEVLDGVPTDFDGLLAYLIGFKGEGIVWHHNDGRMVKLKRRDIAPLVW